MSILVYSYSALLAIGGFIGYMKANSQASLISGVTSALLIAYAAHVTSTNRKLGLQLTMLLSLGLLCFMGNRFYNSQKFMPAGLVTIFSAIVLLKSFFDFQAV
ncbi:hypothetical protein CYY_003811 [Polysphondylium violaceum]|uniref:Transmembrane protein 14 A n=1 Tax=Polysphondylium violaceum TaxID=133409 RepID=A0A8J4PYI8_9MYCE|nr:hypothetical protein CYY_003811 [Polysphondylium violaceum]